MAKLHELEAGKGEVGGGAGHGPGLAENAGAGNRRWSVREAEGDWAGFRPAQDSQAALKRASGNADPSPAGPHIIYVAGS
jgi:hypothetical protein